jgi:Zn-finger nucleic acid-binding protein
MGLKENRNESKRECPRCWVEMVKEKVPVIGRDVVIDVCPNCGGVFLDKDEILRITGNRGLNRYLTKYLGIDSDSQLICPACGGLMDGEKVSEEVIVDVCLTCKGIWLDAGELERIKNIEDDFSTLSPEKMAEVYDEATAKSRNKRIFKDIARRRR